MVRLLLRSRGLTPPTFCQFAWRTGFWYFLPTAPDRGPDYQSGGNAPDGGGPAPRVEAPWSTSRTRKSDRLLVRSVGDIGEFTGGFTYGSPRLAGVLNPFFVAFSHPIFMRCCRLLEFVDC